ncbi:MAG: hypothetical protein SPI34_06480 [Opitutales bacterium]|nr:hypothetical protein [Opitutales bacterium]
MAKIDVELVKQVLVRNNLDSSKIKEILEDISYEVKVSQQEKGEKEPAVKKQFVFVLSDPYGKFKDEDYSGWVIQIPEDDNAMTALERVYQSAYDFNVSPKGRRYPAKKVSEIMEFGSAKIFKEHKLWVKTKEPVLVVRTDNIIPKE